MVIITICILLLQLLLLLLDHYLCIVHNYRYYCYVLLYILLMVGITVLLHYSAVASTLHSDASIRREYCTQSATRAAWCSTCCLFCCCCGLRFAIASWLCPLDHGASWHHLTPRVVRCTVHFRCCNCMWLCEYIIRFAACIMPTYII